MSESIGVLLGRICPSCGEQNSVRLIWGLPMGGATFDFAERGLVELGGCMVEPEPPEFACRSCGLQWGRETDPTADEQELVELLGVSYPEVIRALGAGWRQADPSGPADGIRWFVTGEPAQVAVGVHGPTFVLARPLTRWGEGLELQPADRREFGRDDLVYLPQVVSEAAEAIASRRRRSFRWCRCCRHVRPPEWFQGAAPACDECYSLRAAIDPDF